MTLRHLLGGCACGALRYEVTGPTWHSTLCHCSICRKTSGAPAVAWFSVAVGDFRWLQGTPHRYRSSATATRSFCGACGTQLTFQSDGLDEIDITSCSLDDAESMPPDDQTFVRSALTWTGTAHLLPRHETVRDG